MSQFQLPPRSLGSTSNPMQMGSQYLSSPNANLNLGQTSGLATSAADARGPVRKSLREEVEEIARECMQLPKDTPQGQNCQERLSRAVAMMNQLDGQKQPPTPTPSPTGPTRTSPDPNLDEVERLTAAAAAATDPGTRRAIELRIQQLMQKRFADQLEAERQGKLTKYRAYQADLEAKRVAGNEKLRKMHGHEELPNNESTPTPVGTDAGTPLPEAPAAPAPSPKVVTPTTPTPTAAPAAPTPNKDGLFPGEVNPEDMLPAVPHAQPPKTTPRMPDASAPKPGFWGGSKKEQIQLNLNELYRSGRLTFEEWQEALRKLEEMYKNNPNVANAPAPTLPETTKPPMQNWSEHFHP